MSDTTLEGRRILVVEDEYMIADDLSRALQARGAVVLGPVPRIDDARRLIEAEPDIDGAVLDINLGGEMVFPVIDALAGRGVPLVLSTGYGRSEIPSRYADIPRCEKPVDPEAVAKAMAHGSR